jgi:tetratricopeptide (TPR) repeat protein
MRLFTWKIARQMAEDNLLLGVGADNFGLRFNQARADFAHNHGETVTAEIAEDYMVERAHNEPLQILAELGIVGVILAAVPMITLAIWFALVLFRDRRASPIVLAAAAGIVGFFASSMVSSFSFRAIQNGIAVSILLGLIIRYLLRRSTATASLAALSDRKAIIGTRMIAAGALSLLIAFAFMSARSGLSRFYQYRAQYATEMTARAEMLETSIKLDNENAAALNSFSTVLAASGDVDSAAAALKRSIGLGGGVSQTYSVLADLYIKAGNYTLAEAAMHEAVSIFPGSVFARIRYAQTLEINQKSEEAATQTALAREIDLRQANGWRALIHDGDLNAFNASRRDDQIAAPAELRPMAAVYQFLEPERIITTSQ